MSRINPNRYRRRRGLGEDDVNPMEGAINIVDAMLVFACGLMLSLVIYWNVDLRANDLKPVTQGAKVDAAEELQNGIDGNPADGSGFEEVGKVYRDPATGKLYLAESENTTDSAIKDEGNGSGEAGE